jgi:hypothetical protein
MTSVLRAMSLLHHGARIVCEAALVSCIGACVLASGFATFGCGGAQDSHIGVAAPPRPAVDEWPLPGHAPPDVSTVRTVVSSADGAQVRVRAYLVAVTLPCPACNTGTRKVLREDAIGRTGRPEGPMAPGCSACPPPAVTINDEAPKASASPASPPLRATGAAEGLQARHVGRLFLFTGTFHANGAQGPELEVTDVRTLDAHGP